MIPQAIVLDGMHGLGDNVHQRAVVRRLIDAGHPVWLRTPWPCLYHDFDDRLRLIERGYTLRTQAKNAKRERGAYTREPIPRTARTVRVWYDYGSIRKAGSFVGGMMATTLHDVGGDYDFTLPVPTAWRYKAAAHLGRPSRPVMVLRPLVERKEWGGCRIRNPNHDAYAWLFHSIRDRFFVVSVADLVPGFEDIVGPKLEADMTLHAGELDAEALAGLMSLAAVTFTSPGFAIALSQAVGTPVIAVFGAHESSRFYAYGDRFAPTLGIDPVTPCEHFARACPCDKRIDIATGTARIAAFVESHCGIADRPAIVA